MRHRKFEFRTTNTQNVARFWICWLGTILAVAWSHILILVSEILTTCKIVRPHNMMSGNSVIHLSIVCSQFSKLNGNELMTEQLDNWTVGVHDFLPVRIISAVWHPRIPPINAINAIILIRHRITHLSNICLKTLI